MKQPRKTGKTRSENFREWIGFGICSMLLLSSSAFSEKGTPAGMDTAQTKTMLKQIRDPLWPVGFYPEGWGMSGVEKKKVDPGEQQRQTIVSKGWDVARGKIVINGISSTDDNEFVAIINNHLKSVGEMVVIETGNGKYFWRVVEVQPPGSVKLLRVKAEAVGSVSVNVKDEVIK